MLNVTQNWDNDGYLVIKGAKTLTRYKELQKQKNEVSFEELGLFVAFTDERFNEGYQKMVELGQIKEGDKVCNLGGGVYGTDEGLDRLEAFYEGIYTAIQTECDPQEVYYHEYNNYECCVAWDGDTDAMKEIIRIFGKEAASKIKRINAGYSIDKIIEMNN